MKKLLIGIIACLLPVVLLGCTQVTKMNDGTSTPKLNEVQVSTNNESKTSSQAKSNIQLNQEIPNITSSQAEEIAQDTVSKAIRSVQGKWPEAKLDTVLCRTAMIHENNAFFAYNRGYDTDLQVEAFAIGNKDDYSKMQIIYVDAFGKVLKNNFFEAKITVDKAERIAFQAAKKAKEVVQYWKDANAEHMKTGLVLCTPNYVFSLEQSDKELKVEKVMYEVRFENTNEVSSFLFIYVNATTGDIVGYKYTSD
ncbi:MAG: PepSY domain-containing protein [Desulfitobacteriaceae bacterium]|nr:PepSY domain-containing protein [Desulfitobacteriaceae bacterium]MDD4753593.1 PepSY domain-containing protein [Desulfitobacteriaceae bacterium]